MAYPSLIQKILSLRKGHEQESATLVDLSGELIRATNRVTHLELDKANASMSLEELCKRVAQLEEDNNKLNLANIMLSRQVMELGDMLVHVTMDGNPTIVLNTGGNNMSSFGYMLPTGAVAAPIVLTNSKPASPLGALTAVIS